MKYFTLVIREDDGVWVADFGDYDRETVEYEREACKPQHRAKDLKIIRSGDSQAEIDKQVALLNA